VVQRAGGRGRGAPAQLQYGQAPMPQLQYNPQGPAVAPYAPVYNAALQYQQPRPIASIGYDHAAQDAVRDVRSEGMERKLDAMGTTLAALHSNLSDGGGNATPRTPLPNG
jgi:hypothetical protein